MSSWVIMISLYLIFRLLIHVATLVDPWLVISIWERSNNLIKQPYASVWCRGWGYYSHFGKKTQWIRPTPNERGNSKVGSMSSEH
jgi:hypothetical protein